MIKRFFDYVEIKTKITSLFAFLLTVSYLVYLGQSLDFIRSTLFFVSMLLFDLSTTVINNYIDTKTNHQTLQFQRKTALLILWVLLILATVFGLWLAVITDVVVLILGGLCFACGVLYTWGPVPISRQPLGEILSGIFYGLLIPFIFCYINTPPNTYFEFGLKWPNLWGTLHLEQLIPLALLCLYPILTTANIMLANNICDVEKDILVKRYTLPFYLGEKALTLFKWGYNLTFLATIVGVALGWFPKVLILSVLCFYPVQKNIKVFLKEQDKGKTFPVAIANYVLIMGSNTLLLFLGGWLERL